MKSFKQNRETDIVTLKKDFFKITVLSQIKHV